MNWLRGGDDSRADLGMGTFRVSIQLASVRRERFEVMEALVDTGASYSWIPRDVLERLGARPDEDRVFVLADGREVRYPIAWVRVKIGERIQPTLAVFGDSGTEPILGAFTLEGFGLGVDPVNRRLIPVPALLKAAATCRAF
ncbi:MAG: aspartyl protease family protein [Gemmatimonadales bacterium]